MPEKVRIVTEADYDELVRLRCHFHENPECGPDEQICTMGYICNYLDKLGVEYEYIEGGGVIAFIGNDEQKRTLLLRADVDAVPIQESVYNLSKYKKCISKINGIMHGCGHDAHMSMLLVALRKLLLQKDMTCNLIFLFEEGEEGHNNILKVLDYIDRKKIRVDACYASHMKWDLGKNKIGVCEGAAFVGKISFEIVISGESGHSSAPNEGCNTVDCFNKLYEYLLSLRHLIPPVDESMSFAITSVNSNGKPGFLPADVTAKGYFRTESVETTKRVWDSIVSICSCYEKIYGCKIEVIKKRLVFPVINDEKCVRLFRRVLSENDIEEHINCRLWQASESFNCFSNMYPSIMAFVGIQDIENGIGARHHTPEFDICDSSMIEGTEVCVRFAIAFSTIDDFVDDGKRMSLQELLSYYK